MRSSRTITLFSERPEANQRPYSFVVSVLVHGVAVALVTLGILYTPRIDHRAVAERFTVRNMVLHTPAEQPAGKGIAYPGPHSPLPMSADEPQPAAPQAALRQIVKADKGRQTLVQPDILDPVKLTQETPVPTVVIWAPKKVQVKTIVAPLPEKATASEVKPSFDAPNQEINLADIQISSSDKPATSQAVLPSTTSPLVVHGPDLPQKVPATTSQPSAQPTPTAVLSISDLRMQEGTATLPPANETTAQNETGALASGQALGVNRSNAVGREGNRGDSANYGKGSGGADHRSGPKADSGTDSGEAKANAQPGSEAKAEAGTASGSAGGMSTARITLPKDGQFGVVVVGEALEEKFPEISSIWNERVAYTVYLHVGLAKSWILQYTLPRSAEASSSGNVARLEPPWPYDIVRPNLAPGAINADAVLVHGYVNRAGRFEGLTLAFPPDFQQAQYVLDALSQWQFRPAAQSGQAAKVEVLLIIPEDLEE